MRRHRSNQRPSRTAVAIADTLEARRLLSGNALPLNTLPFAYAGPVFRFSPGPREVATSPSGKAARVSAPTAAPAPANLSASAPPVVAAQTEAERPSITGVYPGNGASNIPPDAFVAADLLFPVAGAVTDPTTLNSNNVRLVRTRDSALIPSVPKTDGAAGVIVLKPADLLDPNTTYRF